MAKKETKRVQIGTKVDAYLWRELRMVAVQEQKNAYELLDEAIQDVIRKHKRHQTNSGCQ